MELASVAPQDAAHGRYHPIAELGQGGTANVYLAIARGPNSFNKLVVLKILKHELAHEASFRSMFMNEARLAARLNHPNVVQTNEVFETDGRPVIVMEYLEGQTLSRILARGRDVGRGGVEMPLSMQLRILVDVLSGLHYSHELCDYDGTPLRVVHRDMTPHNVFVSYDGRVTILDFGIAKLTGLGMQETQTGVIKGKLRYMPAEQVLGTPLDRRADLFAVGVMLWEAATREKMWKGLSDAAIMHNVLHGLIPTPRSVRPDVSPELERIVMKTLSHDKEGRYNTAAELQADLEALLSAESYANRAIGKFVGDQFADARVRMRALVESKLSSLNSQTPSLSSLSEWHLLPPAALSRPRSIGGSDDTSHPTKLDATQTRRDTPAALRFAKVAAAIAVASAVFIVLWQSSKGDEIERLSALAPSTMPQAAAQPAVQVQPDEPALLPSQAVPARSEAAADVRLSIAAVPSSTRLFLDDKPLAGNPHTVVLPADEGQHVLRAEASGYETETRILRYRDNTDLQLSLTKLRRDRPQPKPSEEAEREERPEPREKLAEKNDKAERCAVPYFLDERGIRRIKRECL
jgi:serine/threonine protein kinase